MAPYERKEPRIKTQESAIAVQLDYARSGAQEINAATQCRTGDISVCGVRLSLDTALPVEAPIKITILFKHPPRHFVHMGIVRWSQKSSVPGRYLAGIEFIDKTPAEAQAWKSYLTERHPEALG